MKFPELAKLQDFRWKKLSTFLYFKEWFLHGRLYGSIYARVTSSDFTLTVKHYFHCMLILQISYVENSQHFHFVYFPGVDILCK